VLCDYFFITPDYPIVFITFVYDLRNSASRVDIGINKKLEKISDEIFAITVRRGCRLGADK
jgi:hypothetical protein